MCLGVCLFYKISDGNHKKTKDYERKFSNFEEEYSNRQKDLIASYIDEDEYDE